MFSYNYYNPNATSTWTINHGLNTSVIVNDVMVDTPFGVEKILPETVKMIDNNTMEITFTSAQSGYARIIGSA